MDGGMPIASGLKLARPALEDFAYIAKRMRPDEIAQFKALTGMRAYDADLAARAMALTAGPTFALIGDDNRPVIVGGFAVRRKGVFEGWLAAPMDAWERHWRRITRECVRQMDALLTLNAHRIEVCALASRAQTHAWYERIGFRREGVLHGYFADGQDGVMYARTKI